MNNSIQRLKELLNKARNGKSRYASLFQLLELENKIGKEKFESFSLPKKSAGGLRGLPADDRKRTKGTTTMKIRGGTALARSLNETFRNVLIEGTHRDSHGDKWSSHSAVRNETHPYFQKSKNLPKLNGLAREEGPRQVFLNHRTHEVTEGEMLLHSDGKVSPFSHSGKPKLFNSSHYFFHEDE
jgi:hypothetical protein